MHIAVLYPSTLASVPLCLYPRPALYINVRYPSIALLASLRPVAPTFSCIMQPLVHIPPKFVPIYLHSSSCLTLNCMLYGGFRFSRGGFSMAAGALLTLTVEVGRIQH